MRSPLSALTSPTYAEPVAIGIALVGLGTFVGAWVIGPALSHDVRRATAKDEVLSYQQMLQQPDPPPYRTPTPEFDMSSQPHYGETARQRARAELGGQRPADAAGIFDGPFGDQGSSQPARNYRRPDPHTQVF